MLAEIRGHGEAPGAVRRAIAADGSVQIERLEEIDHADRRYRYAIDSGALPVRDYRAELHVKPADDGGSAVRWAADIPFYAEPGHEREGELNGWNGGRGLYFSDPNDGHNVELLTAPA